VPKIMSLVTAPIGESVCMTDADPPLFVLRSRVWFDELDLVGVLHNARYAVHAERAMAAWFDSRSDLDGSPDHRQLVKAYAVEFHAPIAGPIEFDVELRVAKLGRTSCVFDFRFVGLDGTVYATGTRTIVRIDDAKRPAAWTEAFRRIHEGRDAAATFE
jgi:acyl-CoA thioester hydrolase